jgi:formamidopyrimidine-DNA glycosylase
MPELPEVQTIINVLKRSKVVNKTITDVVVYKPKLLKNSTPEKLKHYLLKEKVTDISRIGKYLIFHLSNKKIMCIHLRMEGKLFFEDIKYTLPKNHLRVEFIMGKKALRFYDSRMFGTIHIYGTNEYMSAPVLKKIAIDPFNKLFTNKYLRNKIGKSNRYIKTELTNQEKISGIGNIYADEILFICKINPLRKCKDLTAKDYVNIVKYSKSILASAINFKGTTVSSFKSSHNIMGGYQNRLKVYGRAGQKCVVCGTIIKKIKINGRGSCYCPKCQAK